MAKKTHIKVRLVPESKPDSPFFYYVKKPAGGEKAKIKLKTKKYNPSTRKHEIYPLEIATTTKLVAINVAHGQGLVKPCRMSNRSCLKFSCQLRKLHNSVRND